MPAAMPKDLLCTAVLAESAELWEKSKICLDPEQPELDWMLRLLKSEARQKMLEAALQALERAHMAKGPYWFSARNALDPNSHIHIYVPSGRGASLA